MISLRAEMKLRILRSKPLHRNIPQGHWHVTSPLSPADFRKSPAKARVYDGAAVVTGRLQWVAMRRSMPGRMAFACRVVPSLRSRVAKYRERKLHMVLLEVVNANRHFTSDQINW